MEVEASDAIRLVLQFLRENSLLETMRTLQQESQVSLNAVESVDDFLKAMKEGKWDAVLQQTSALACSSAAMMDLYEQVVLEMIELKEKDVAQRLLRSTPPMEQMKQQQPERYLKLEKLAQAAIFDPEAAYSGSTKQARRQELAQKFQSEVTTAAPSRLLTLLGEALKYQQLQGRLPEGSDYDLFNGTTKAAIVEHVDKIVKKPLSKIKFAKSSLPQSAAFTRDGRMLVTGSKDGFVEVWDFDKGTLRKDLAYQANDEFMMHDKAVTAMDFSRDGEMLATASEDGQVKVWKLSTGVCLRRFEHAHNQTIHSITFSYDGSQLLTGAFDHLIRVHGLKSGRTLKEFAGHDGYVNSAFYSSDNGRIISVASDGKIKLWDAKTGECISTIEAPNNETGLEVEIVQAHLIQDSGKTKDELVVCTQTKEMFRMSMRGDVTVTYKAEDVTIPNVGAFVSSYVSPRQKYVYGITDKGYLLCFHLDSGDLAHCMQISKSNPLGLLHHPHRNLVATYASDRYVRVWKA